MAGSFDFISTLGTTKRRKGGAAADMQSDQENNLFVSQGLPPYAELNRRGDVWTVMTATAFAAVVTVPTTTAALEIHNNTSDRYMVVLDIFSWQLLGTAVVWAHTPWAQVGASVYSANTALVFYDGMGGSYTSSTSGPMRTAINQTVVANGWTVFPGSTMASSLAAATPAGACIGQVDGKLIVPPKLSLHIEVSASVTTASAFQCGARFAWADITAR